MYDYRRNQKREDQNSIFDRSKNLASIAIVGTAGYQYLKKTNQMIKTVEEASRALVRKERENLENLAPLATDNLIDRLEKNAQQSPIHKAVFATDYDQYANNPFRVEEVEDISDEYLEDYTEDLVTEKEPSIKQFLGDHNMTNEEMVERLANEQANFSNARAKLEKKYPGLQASIQRKDLGMDIVYVKESKGYAKTFDLLVESSSGKRVKISIPNYTNGYIREGFREWMHRPAGILSADQSKVIAPRFDRSFLGSFVPKLDRLMSESEKLKTDPALLLKRYVENTTSYLFQKEGVAVTTNSAMALGGYSFIATQVRPYASEAAYDRKKRDEALRWWNSFEGKPLYLQTGQIDLKGEQENLVDTGKIVSMTGVSETSFTKTTAMATSPEFGMGPGFDFHKQSTFRQNAMKGWGVTKSRDRWVTQLGMASEGYLATVADKFTEDYTGRMSHIGFYFGEEKNIFDGATVYVNQYVDGKPMSMDFIGRKTESIHLKFSMKGGEHERVVKMTSDLYSDFKNGKEVRVHKGQAIGFNPANNKVIHAPRSGIITHMHVDHETGEAKVILSSDKGLNVGDKILQTKEVIEHVVDSKSLKGFYLGGEDQEIAEYISRGEGKLGIEFLMNGSTMKRFMNGGVGMGFVNKVLSDVLQMKKEEFHKLTNDGDRMDFMKNMKSFAGDFINYQLGPEARAAIKEIHIDNDMNIGLELHENYRSSSDVFHKTLDIESLIQHGEKYNNWDPFIKRMDSVEKFINSHKNVGAINYNVVAYAKTLRDNMKENPRHLSAFVMGGSKAEPGRLVQANLKMLLATHSVSNINVASTAGLEWNSRGFIGGVKLSAEMRRNFSAMGFHGLSSYADFLMDYRMNYILDKTKMNDFFVLDSKKLSKSGNHITIGQRNVNVKTVEFMLNNPDDIIGKLQKEVLIGDELKMFHSIRMARNSLHNLQGVTNQDIIDKIANADLLSAEDLLSVGKEGIGGNSIGLITKDLMHKLVEEINNVDPTKRGSYLKLPFEINFGNNMKGDLVSLINFDKEDSFEIASAKFKDLDGAPAGTKLKHQSYTLGGMQGEYLDYFKKVAEATEEWNKAGLSEKRRGEIVANIELATHRLAANMRNLTEGKNAAFTQAVHNGATPFSARGEVKGAKGLKLGEIGVTADRLTAILTGNQTQSFGDLENKVKAVELLKDLKEGNIEKIAVRDKKGDLHLKMTRGVLAKYRKSLRSVAGNIPEGELIMGHINELADILNKGVDAVGRPSTEMQAKLAEGYLRTNTRNSADAILKILEDEHINNSNALAVMNAVKQGKTDLYFTGERFPIKGPGAQSFWKLKLYQDEAVNAKDYIRDEIKKAELAGVKGQGLEYVRKNAIERTKRVHSYLYLNQADTLGISGDNDKDFVNIMLTSLDTVQDIHVRNMRTLGMTNEDISEFHLKNTRAMLFNTPVANDMSMDTLRGYIERLTVIKPSDDRNFRPANAQSSIITDVINNAKYLKKEASVNAIDLRKGIEDTVEKTYSNLTKHEKENIVEGLMTHAHTKLKSYYPGADFGQMKDNLKFITDLNYIDFRHSLDEKISSHVKIIDPDTGMLSDDELALHRESVISSKELHNKYTRTLQDRYVNRFGEMKWDTPTAYKLGANINRLAENARIGEAEKDFMYTLADRITQTTISTKHGTPSYLDFYRRTILHLESSKHADADTIIRLTNGNLDLDMPGFKREMKGYGFIKSMDESIDFDTFQNYLSEKERIGSILKEAHDKAGEEKIKSIKSGVRDIQDIQRKYRATIDGYMANHSVNGIHDKTMMSDILKEHDWMYSPETTNRFILMTADEKKNATAARESISGFSKEQWEGFALRLKTAKLESSFSLLQDPYENVRTKIHATIGSEGAAYHMENLAKTMEYADVLDAHSSQQSLLKVMAANYRMEVKSRLGSVSEEKIMKKIQASETAHIKREIFQRSTKPTIFYQGSILDGLAGKTHEVAVPTPEGIRAANGRGSAKLKALGIGFLVGAFIGQSINLLTDGNAIPGMGKSPGTGGEYYENNGMLGPDIMGRKMEVFSSEKPVKLASEWSYWNNEMKYQRGINNMKDSTIQRDNPRYQTSFKGVMVG